MISPFRLVMRLIQKIPPAFLDRHADTKPINERLQGPSIGHPFSHQGQGAGSIDDIEEAFDIGIDNQRRRPKTALNAGPLGHIHPMNRQGQVAFRHQSSWAPLEKASTSCASMISVPKSTIG